MLPRARVRRDLEAVLAELHRDRFGVDRGIRENRIKATTGMKLLDDYRKAFSDYTYLK